MDEIKKEFKELKLSQKIIIIVITLGLGYALGVLELYK